MTMAIQAFQNQGPGNPVLARVDEEGVPQIVQTIVLLDDMMHLHLFDESVVTLSVLQCGGLFSDGKCSSFVYDRAEEIFLANWSDFVSNRKRAMEVAGMQEIDPENDLSGHGLH